MATLYTEIYGSFLSKISDYSFINLTEGEIESQLFDYLRSSIPKFRNCKVDLSNRTEFEFIEQLSDEEIEILSSLMVVEFLKPKIVSSDLYKQVMTDKEYRFYSQANHLEQLQNTYKLFKKEASDLMKAYGFGGLYSDK